MLVQLNPPSSYDDKRLWQLMQDFMARARGVPGVISAAAVSGRPLSDGSTGLGLAVPGKDVAGGDVPWGTWRLVTPDYFRAMGVPLLRGRTFTDADVVAGEQMTAVVSERVVKQLFDGKDPIGRDLIVWKGQGDRHARIVGVVGDMRERGLDSAADTRRVFPVSGYELVARAGRAEHDDPHRGARAGASGRHEQPGSRCAHLRRADVRRDGGRLGSLTALHDDTARFFRAARIAAGARWHLRRAGLQRRQADDGDRGQDGAGCRRGKRAAAIVGQGLRPVLAGVGVGLLAAGALSQLMTRLLFEVAPTDFVTYALVATSILVAGVAACLVPRARQCAWT